MDVHDQAAALVRARDPDRYFADLFVPAEARRHFFALHAFNAEVVRIREAVSEPMPGEIRIQWWRDVLSSGEAQGHPIASALVETMRACRLPVDALDRLLEAHIFDLYDDPIRDLVEFEAYAGNTASALFQFGALILARGDDPRSADAAGHGGIAYALAGLMRALPAHARRGQMYLPEAVFADAGAARSDVLLGKASEAVKRALMDLRAIAREHLHRAEAAVAVLAPAVRPAFLPLALVEPRLQRLERIADPFAAIAETPQWRRQWVLWRAARRL